MQVRALTPAPRPSSQARFMSTRASLYNIFGPVLTMVAIVVLWKGIEVGWQVPRYMLPTPDEVLSVIIRDWPLLLSNIWATLKVLLIGFVFSIAVAVPLGYVVVTFRWAQSTLYPILLLFQLIPKSIVAPLLVVWFGIGMPAKTTLVIAMTFFPILLETIAGLRNVDKRYFYLTRSMGANRGQAFFLMQLPTAMPFIFAGMKTAMVYAITAAIIAEYIGSNEGIGYLILSASGSLDMPLTFAAVIAAGLLGVILSISMVVLERFVMPWKSETGSH